MLSPRWSASIRCADVGIPPLPPCTRDDSFQVIHMLRAAATPGSHVLNPEPR